MTWNYRICLDTKALPVFSIREVYYREDGSVQGWTADPVELMGETPDAIKADLELILKDTFDRKMLDITDEDNPREIG